MNLHPAAVLAGGAACFSAVVALGAFAIASLTPAAAPPVVPAGASLFVNEPPRASPVAPADPRPVSLPVLLPVSLPPPPAQPPPQPVAESGANPGPVVRDVPPRRARRKPSDELASENLQSGFRDPVAAPVRVPRQEQAARFVPAAPEQAARSAPVRPFAGVEPPPARPPIAARTEGIFTQAEIGRMRGALRLTPEQRGHWPPVETVLREIGAQQTALVASGRRPNEAYSGGMSMRLYWAASPLLGVLRPDQKEEIRRRARAMGFDSVASAI